MYNLCCYLGGLVLTIVFGMVVGGNMFELSAMYSAVWVIVYCMLSILDGDD